MRKGWAERAVAIESARFDPEAGAMSAARQMTDFMNDGTLLSGDDQQHQAQHSVYETYQGSGVSATRHMQKLTESAANCSIHAPSWLCRTHRTAADGIG